MLCKHEVVGSIPSGSTIIFALSPFGLHERDLVHQIAFSVFAWDESSGAKRRQARLRAARSGRAIGGQGEARCGREISNLSLKKKPFCGGLRITACS